MAGKRLRKTFIYDGKRHYVEAYSEKELWMKYAEKLHDLEQGNVKSSNQTVEQWTWRAVDVYKAGMTYEVRKKYDRKMKFYVLRHIGSYKLKDVKPIQCQQILNAMTRYSKYTIDDVYKMLRFIFRTAYDNNLIPNNPTLALVKPVGKPPNKRRAITDQEQAALLEAVKLFPNADVYLFMLYCGCRPKEARNICHEDLYMNKSGKPVLHIRGTKTVNADRVVPCPPDLYEKYHSGSGLLFTTAGNKPYTEDYFRKLTKRLFREMDIIMGAKLYRNKIVESKLDKSFTPYCLRHTYCTNLAKKGIDVRIAQKLMGHASIEMTANIYTHIETDELDLDLF